MTQTNQWYKDLMSRRMRNIRKQRNLGQYRAARQLGIPRSSFNNWEAGKHLPNAENLELLHEEWSIDVHQLITKGESIYDRIRTVYEQEQKEEET